MLFRVVSIYACLMMLLVAGAGLRIGVVEPLAQGWGEYPKAGETDGAAVSSKSPVHPECAPRDCVSAALEHASPTPDGVPLWAIGTTD